MNWGALSFDPHPGPVLHVASGFLLLALAVFVASVKPRRRANLAFAGFSGGWGLAEVVDWSIGTGPGMFVAPPTSVWHMADALSYTLLMAVAAACIPAVALWFPSPIAGRERRFVKAAVATGVAFGVLATAVGMANWNVAHRALLASGVPAITAGAFLTADLVNAVGRLGAILFALVLLALRARLAQREGRHAELRQYALVSAALMLQPAVNVGILTALVGLSSTGGLLVVARYALLCALAALWLASAREGGPGARIARNVAVLAVALPLVGYGLYTFFSRVVQVAAPPGIDGAARTLTVLTLAYAILRHQLLGIDVKVRFAISRSSIAAVFVVAFFVASEGAQILFGQGNEWVGLLAAGALVFAIAPLQRAAERLAERAVPVAESRGDERSGADPEVVYREAVTYALRDGHMTRREEVHLAALAQLVGIGAADALRIRHEVEDAVRGGADTPTRSADHT